LENNKDMNTDTTSAASTRELTYEERYDYWFANNYETGMEKNYKEVPDFDCPYYTPTPTKVTTTITVQITKLYEHG